MITPLRCGVDTLESTFYGQIDEEFYEVLETRKKRAGATGVPEEFVFQGDTFYLSPKGASFWSYVLRSDEMMLFVSRGGHMPPLKVKLLAQGLAEVGVGALWEKAKDIGWLDFGLHPNNCTRLDIALDYQGGFFTHEEMLNIVCPATFRPVYPNTVNPETFQIGKGKAALRAYNKSAEIAAKQTNQWWKFVWRMCEGYNPEQPVYRVEVQLRSEALKELGYRSVDHLIEEAELRNLFDYGLRWCSLRVPTGDSNKSRWPEDPRWTALRTAYASTRTLGRIRPAHAVIGYDAAVKRMLGLIVSAGAAVESDDYWTLARALTTDVEQLIEREMDTTYSALVEKKRKQRYL